jgi:PIN domain nuclease of toxin-antitoxin system
MIVLDTHVFLWYALDDTQLNGDLKSYMEQRPGDVLVPSICIWEALLLVEKGRIAIAGDDPGAALMRYVNLSGFAEAPLTNEIAALSRSLPFEHDDPADRFIAATAHVRGASLATSDDRLRRLDWVQLAY